jgi:Skp family chaperone for outer membrane proteins
MRLEKALGLAVFIAVVLTMVMLFSSFTGAASSQANFTVGFFDFDQLRNELPDFQQYKELLKNKETEYDLVRASYLQEQNNKAKAFQEKANLEMAGKTPDEQEAIKKKLRADIQLTIDQAKAQIEKKKGEIEKYIADQEKALMEKIRQYISDVATDKKFSLVLTKSVVFYGGTDITKDILEKAKKEAGKPSPSASPSK